MSNLRVSLVPATLAVLTVIALLSPGVEAAVMVCGDAVEGSGREDAQEVAAKKSALDSWHSRVGPDYTWRLATNKSLTCTKSQAGRFICKAIGHPCAPKQVPPAGPLKRLMPSAPDAGK